MIVVEAMNLLEDSNKISRYKSGYDINMWEEAKKIWRIGVVALALFFAVLAPNVGAYGGVLHSEYIKPPLLWGIYFVAGRLWTPQWPACSRLTLATVIQSRCVSPAIAGLLAALPIADYRAHSGLISTSLCPAPLWLPLSASRGSHVVPLLADQLLAVLTMPLAAMFACGQIILTTVGTTILPILHFIPPFLVGTVYSSYRPSEDKIDSGHDRLVIVSQCCAVLLLYFECCEQVSEAEGGLYVGDVIGIFILVCVYTLLCVCACVLVCVACRAGQQHGVVCAIGRSCGNDWGASSSCAQLGLRRVPGVAVCALQALVLAFLSR